MRQNRKTSSLRMSLPKDFCPLPFTQLFFYPTGEVFTCCEIGIPLGDLKQATITEIWNGEKLRGLREEFLSGKIKTCAQPIKTKGCNTYNEDMLSLCELSPVQKNPVRAFDLILNGQCNLQCIMCPVWDLPNGVFDETTFWSEGRETIFPQLKYIHVKSGEPFIQKDTYRLIRGVSAVNRECRWRFTTNGQYRFNSKIREHLDLIALDSISVSLDSLDEGTYPRIRKGGLLKRSLQTVGDLAQYRDERKASGRPFSLRINMAVQKQNWREVPAMVRYARGLGILNIFLFVFDPAEHSLLSLAKSERSKALDLFVSMIDEDPSLYGYMKPLLLPLATAPA